MPNDVALARQQTSFRLLAYNLTLYLSLLTAIPSLSIKRRLLLAATSLPLVVGLHVLDLALVVESKLLTLLGQPESLASAAGIWFAAVKFSHSFSVLAFRQAAPALVLLAQWAVARRWWDGDRPAAG